MKHFTLVLMALSLMVGLVGVGCGDDGPADVQCMNDGQCADLGPNFRCDLASNTCRCVPSCDGLCCGGDGCDGTCDDNCAAAGETCNAESCHCEGGSTCTQNDTRCDGNLVETCSNDTWSVTVDCAGSGEVCVDGACVPTGTCTEGETRCDGDLVETCGNNAWSVSSN